MQILTCSVYIGKHTVVECVTYFSSETFMSGIQCGIADFYDEENEQGCVPAVVYIDLSLMPFTFLFQPKGFRRYYSSPLLIQEQYGCIKEVLPIGEQLCIIASVLCDHSPRTTFPHEVFYKTLTKLCWL